MPPEMQPWMPLGDQALLAHCPDETHAFALAETVRRRNWPWVLDVVQAYTSLAVFLDPGRIDFFQARQTLLEIEVDRTHVAQGRLATIPCCYELGPDLERVAHHRGLSPDEVVRLHTETIYTVYAIGFCPGFPYLGYLPDALAGMPRLESPRVKVEAGSVGLTGRQTGIYTEARPGGWNLIGRTPFELVHVADQYFPLRTGDRVQFTRVNTETFHQLRGQRLRRNDECADASP